MCLLLCTKVTKSSELIYTYRLPYNVTLILSQVPNAETYEFRLLIIEFNVRIFSSANKFYALNIRMTILLALSTLVINKNELIYEVIYVYVIYTKPLSEGIRR